MRALRTSEDDLKAFVIQYAQWHGWMVVHYRPCRTSRGWRTALQGNQGAPDLILARGGEVLLAELKSDRGRLGPGQAEWAKAAGDYYRLWRPRNLDLIKQELK